jgi:D-alanyl-D-alanine carboxypeptidase
MKKSHKTQIATLLAVFMAFVITACSSGGSGASQNTSPAQASNEGQTVEAEQDTSQNAVEQAQEADTTVDTTVSQAASTSATTKAAETAEAINYLALVNKLNPLPDVWEDTIETIHMTNSVGDDVEVEKKAYDAYLKLKEDLEKEGIYVDLDSARRSVAEQQRIMDDFTQKYGADYALKTVATPGYSEHHTGLALDLYLIIDGKDVVENEDMIQYPEIWEVIHSKLADYGFILRYLEGKEHITGYGYEPWHIRYVDDPKIAKEITDSGVTLEGWLGAVNETDVEIDYGTSEIFTPEELAEAAIQIKCTFAGWKGCELHSLRYAGDEADKEENLQWLNSLNEEAGYTHVAEFLTDFHSPVEAEGAWEPDQEYKDYQWWLGRTDDGGWEVVTSGY